MRASPPQGGARRHRPGCLPSLNRVERNRRPNLLPVWLITAGHRAGPYCRGRRCDAGALVEGSARSAQSRAWSDPLLGACRTGAKPCDVTLHCLTDDHHPSRWSALDELCLLNERNMQQEQWRRQLITSNRLIAEGCKHVSTAAARVSNLKPRQRSTKKDIARLQLFEQTLRWLLEHRAVVLKQLRAQPHPKLPEKT
jgi:hypothetical protein